MLKIGTNNNSIEFKIEVENTTLDKINPRLVLEMNEILTIIPLKIDNQGLVKGNIPLKEEWEGKKGNIKLEIINESNYFVPFEKEVEFINIEQTPKAIVKEVKTFTTSPKVKIVPSINFLKEQTEKIKQESQSLIKETREFLSLKEINMVKNTTEEINNFFKNKS